MLLLAALFLMFALVARRLSSTMVTAPMVFIGAGFLFVSLGWVEHEGAEKALHVVAEVALVLLLFLDAAQIDLRSLKKQHTWPVRMLLIGMPLALVIGTAAVWLVLPDWPLVAVALVAALLAPTDAALGQSVVSNPAVPKRVRRSLTIESGLNDGMALPAVLLFAALASGSGATDDRNWLLFAAMQLGLGPLAGIAIGLAGGYLTLFAHKHEFSSEATEGIGVVALAGMAYFGAEHVGGNGFIAAFVAGLCFGRIVGKKCGFVFEFGESEGQMLTWAAFFLLGCGLMPMAIAGVDARVLAVIAISLFVVRPLSIWLSLLGSGAAPETKLFFGWFGPRGLATALFALLVVPQVNHELAESIIVIAINAVWISALLHGMSAAPFAKAFAALIEKNKRTEEVADVASVTHP